MARKDDNIPVNDADLATWLTTMVNYLSAHAAEYGITPEDVASLAADSSEFGDSLADFQEQQRRMTAASGRKKNARAAVEKRVRPLVRQITSNPRATDEERGKIGLKRINRQKVRREVGSEVPSISLESQPGMVTVHFGTDATNELRNGKPEWASGCRIYRHLSGEAGMIMVGQENSSPYFDTITVEATLATYVVQYIGRRKGQFGQCSAPMSIAVGSPMPKLQEKALPEAA